MEFSELPVWLQAIIWFGIPVTLVRILGRWS